MKKCYFIGHRDAKGIENIIRIEMRKLLENKEIEFYSGGMGNFDLMCEHIAKEFGCKIVFVPYNISRIKNTYKMWYDDIICPFADKPYSKYDIPNRNKWLVDISDICLCYVNKSGGAEKTYRYAVEKNKKIIDIL